jgi:DNA polymerase-3 subunit gamma/tau
MAYQVLARKYRPQLFSDVIGQDHVTRTLLNALAQKRIAPGYIFSGHRGIGKTTIARILAAALNCSTPVGTPERPTEEPCRVCVNCREISSASRQENSIFEESHSFDVEEIDAATNRGIDDARLLTAKIQTRPTNKSKYKIIILDEAHQITDAAWNALLKTLEEPPEWAIFMFATTQPEDIPQTIRSRCQHFSFHAVKLDDIVSQLRFISEKEAITVDDATLTLLAEAGDGSMRDALSVMDQAIASAPVVDGQPHLEITQVRELMGSVSNVVYEQILGAVHDNNSADVLAITGRLLDAGNGAPQLARQFVRYLRNTIVAKVTKLAPGVEATGTSADLLQISPEERSRAARSAALFTEEELSRFLSIMLRTFDELGYRQEQRFHLELGLLKLVHVQRLLPIEELLSQLGAKPGTTPSITATSRSAAAPATLRPSAPPLPIPASTPPPSPFASDSTRKSPFASAAPISVPAPPVPQPSAPVAPASRTPELTFTPTAKPVMDSRFGDNGSARTAGSMALAADRAITPAPAPAEIHLVDAAPSTAPATGDLVQLQQALVTALASVKGQQSASEQIEESTLSAKDTTLEIQTSLSKTMLSVVINAEAERIMKSALRDANAGSLTIKLLPGTPAPAGAAKKPRQAASGSAAELAQKHPIVQQAREMFSADISNVIDLRDKG